MAISHGNPRKPANSEAGVSVLGGSVRGRSWPLCAVGWPSRATGWPLCRMDFWTRWITGLTKQGTS